MANDLTTPAKPGPFEIKIMYGAEARSLVDPFYEKHGSGGRAREDDVFFLAWSGSRLVGCVRFCVEEHTPLLRTMMIDADYRRQDIGSALLSEFARYLDQRGIRGTYCLPYSHLEKFYGQVGFTTVTVAETPAFLAARMKLYDPSGGRYLCMRRA